LGNNFWLDMALSILFSVLREKEQLPKIERAMRKLVTVVCMAYGWSIQFEPEEVRLNFPKA